MNQTLLAKLEEWLKAPGEEFDDGAYLPSAEVCSAAKTYLENNPPLEWPDIFPDGEGGISFEAKDNIKKGNMIWMEWRKDGVTHFMEFINCKMVLSLYGRWDGL